MSEIQGTGDVNAAKAGPAKLCKTEDLMGTLHANGAMVPGQQE